jgi:hypothetical protein
MAPEHPFPRMRFLALIWLLVYLPAYTQAYGLLNFLFLCNLGVILSAYAIWRGDALLLSSQAVGAPIVCAVWVLDVGSRLATGRHWIGGTEYMWDQQFSLFQRLLSCYHVFWPFVLIACLRRVGYDRRAYRLQAGIAALAIVVSRVAPAQYNINFAWVDPILHRAFEPALLHLLIVIGVLVGVVYGLTHLTLKATFRDGRAGSGLALTHLPFPVGCRWPKA